MGRPPAAIPPTSVPSQQGQGAPGAGALPPRDVLEGLDPRDFLQIAQQFSPEAMREQQMGAVQQQMQMQEQALRLEEKQQEAIRNHPVTFRNRLASTGHTVGRILAEASPGYIDRARGAGAKGESAKNFADVTTWMMDDPDRAAAILSEGGDEMLLEQAFGGSQLVYSMDPRVTDNLSSIAQGAGTERSNVSIGGESYQVWSKKPMEYALDDAKARAKGVSPGTKVGFDDYYEGVSALAKEIGLRRALGMNPTDAQQEKVKALSRDDKARFFEASSEWANHVRGLQVQKPGGKPMKLSGEFLDEHGLRTSSRRYGQAETSLDEVALAIGLERDWTPATVRSAWRSARQEILSQPRVRQVSKTIDETLGEWDLPASVRQRIGSEALRSYMSRDNPMGISWFELDETASPEESARNFKEDFLQPYIRRQILSNPDLAWERVRHSFTPRSERLNGESKPLQMFGLQEKFAQIEPQRYMSKAPGVPGKYAASLFGGRDDVAGQWNEMVGLPLPYTWSPADAQDEGMLAAQEAMARTVDLLMASRGQHGAQIAPGDIVEQFFMPTSGESIESGGGKGKLLDSRLNALRRWINDPTHQDDPLLWLLGHYIQPPIEPSAGFADWSQFGPQFNEAMRMVGASNARDEDMRLPPRAGFTLPRMVKNQY